MTINFSRHAKRRVKLYKIPESEIEKFIAESKLNDGEQVLIKNIDGFGYPIKILISRKKEIVTVITCYPLKKGKVNESTL
ncbi:DUF4258 domain-containing protein [candidate division KSB1 bacterium]|nr:DUF4258 domain-containing protein [candidate division KSB1 bacterium]